MTIRAEDLDPATRARLGLDAGGRGKSRPSRAGSSGWNLACHDCGYRPSSDATASAHALEHGHVRYELKA